MLAEIPAHVRSENVVDFDIYHLPDGVQDYFEAWRRLQVPNGPDMVWTPRNGGHWIVVRGRHMLRIWSESDKFSSSIVIVPKSDAEKNRLIPSTLDPPAYDPYRRVMKNAFSPRRIAAMEKPVRGLAVSLIEGIVPNGRCNFTTEYAEQLPIRVFMGMCRLPMEDAAMLKSLADRMIRPDDAGARDGVGDLLRRYLAPIIAQRHGADGDDLLTLIANAEINGRPINAEEALQMSMNLLFAGLDTVVNFLGFVMHFLATNESHRRALVANGRLIPQAVEELFRRFPIVTQARLVTQDQHFAGVELRVGDVVVIPSALHGLDEEENKRPLEVDFTRRNASQSTFGGGAHSCIGLVLAKTEVRVTIEEWLTRIPDFRVEAGAQIRHQSGIVASVVRLPLCW